MQTKGVGTIFKIMSAIPVTVGELTAINPPSMSADTIDTTTLSSADGYRTFIQGWKDGGEVSVSGYYDPTTGNGQAELEALFDSGEVEGFNIVFVRILFLQPPVRREQAVAENKDAQSRCSREYGGCVPFQYVHTVSPPLLSITCPAH